jgi:hypothetical protein
LLPSYAVARAELLERGLKLNIKEVCIATITFPQRRQLQFPTPRRS